MLRQLKLLDHALSGLWQRRYKNFSLLLVYALTVAVLGSVLLLTQALQKEALTTLNSGPELVVQRILAGRHDLIPTSYAETIARLPGVESVTPRVWGYYYDSLIKANLTLLGIEGADQELELLKGRLPAEQGECALGEGVMRAFGPGLGDSLMLEDSAGDSRIFQVTGVFRSPSNLLTNDLVVLREADLRAFFGMPARQATDLAVKVYNPQELNTLAKKIRYHLPDTRPLSRPEVLHTYRTLFNWRSGMMLAVSVGALIAFCILAWDKATGLSAEEKREIGILKALGWETGDVLASKLWEGLAISLTAFLLGLLGAWLHVFVAGAPALTPLLKGWSVLYPDYRLVPAVDLYQLAVLGCLTIVPYLASTLVPAWKAAVTDPDQVIKG